MTNEEIRQLQQLPKDQQMAYLLQQIEKCQQLRPARVGCWTPYLDNLERLNQLKEMLKGLESSP